MKIETLKIEKFRAIRHCEIALGSETALVGQNSSGKSSILRALNAVFNFKEEEAYFESKQHQFLKTSVAVITVGFSDVPDECTIPRVGDAADKKICIRLRYKKSAVWEVCDGNAWVSASVDLHEKLGEYIGYVYIPLKRDHEVSSWKSDGLLKKAVDAWMQKYTAQRDRISPKVTDAVEAIKGRALSSLGRELRKSVPLSAGFSFQLDYRNRPDYKLLLQDLSLKVTEGNTSLELEDCGSGTQSMAAFALYSYLANLKNSTYVLGVEEPEVNLHPQAQKELLKSLKDMPLQVIFKTHSIVMVNQLDHEDVVLCRRGSSSSRSVELSVTQLKIDFWQRLGLDRSNYTNFYKRANSEFFFSGFVVVCESPIDGEVIGSLLKGGGADPDYYSVSIMPLNGVGSLPYVYWLLKELSIPFVTVLDKDYFIPYLNDELHVSRHATTGFPKYKKVYNNNTLLAEMVPSEAQRTDLLDKFHSNHSKAMDILERAGVFCFRWALEIDLIAGPKAVEEYYDFFGLAGAERNTIELLVNRRKAIKRVDSVMTVVNSLSAQNLPNSYKRIRKKIPELIKSAVVR